MLEAKFQTEHDGDFDAVSVWDGPSALSYVVEVDDEKGETFLIHLGGCRSRGDLPLISQVKL